jgi:hypothetical protein
MILIRHRRNTVAELQATPTDWGVEVDIRSRGPELIIHHDPFEAGTSFEDWLRAYRHRCLILNVKEEGLEDRLLALMAAHGIENFFFLDQSFPFLVRTANGGEKRCAVRVSEYETIDTALSLAGRIEWVWVDYFTRFPLDRDDADRLRAAGFKLCLVSPELQGRTDPGEIDAMRRTIDTLGIEIDAVCSKTPERWR